MAAGLVVAFVAGLVSFLSPCVAPLVPGLVAYLAGTTPAAAAERRWEIFRGTVFFVLGFSVVFSAIGVALNTVLEAVAYDIQLWLARLGGLIILLFGLVVIGVLKIPFLERAHTLKLGSGKRGGYLSAFLFGAAFAMSWTPCVGAVLGSILGLAAAYPGTAFLLLLSYTLGLGLPFLLVGAFAGEAAALIARAGNWLSVITKVFGAILIILGVLSLTGYLSRVVSLFTLQS